MKKYLSKILLFFLFVMLSLFFYLAYQINSPGKRDLNLNIDKSLKNTPFSVITDDNIKIVGNFFDMKNSSPVILLSHGITHNRTQNIEKVKFLLKNHYSAIIYDLRAHGKSGGTYQTLGYKEALDIKAIVKWLKKKGKDKIIGWGFSLGGASVINYQARFGGFKAIILQGMFADVDGTIKRYAVLRYHLPKFLLPLVDVPILISRFFTGLIGVNYSPDFVAQKITVPVLIVAGSSDIKAPVSDAKLILKNLKGKKELLILKNCTHGTDFFSYSIYKNKVLEFLKNYE